MESDGRSALEVALVRAENARVESERLRELVARLLAQNEVEEAVDANVDRVSPRSSLRYRSSNA